ncbi:mitochondrial transcription rescue factor 1-like [Physella acuta]|uniref:mitochondrial transcription rescue factor 1-like n=1 Tax=Physella acuta TaxID=109671 RepID=UPI0027DD9D43|nr:mitochondrial transcription rescue factor 1-like [Physella acuta]XP_059145869.1 mitochondrial transcription rescue factor 1-like [Physella acuta]
MNNILTITKNATSIGNNLLHRLLTQMSSSSIAFNCLRSSCNKTTWTHRQPTICKNFTSYLYPSCSRGLSLASRSYTSQHILINSGRKFSPISFNNNHVVLNADQVRHKSGSGKKTSDDADSDDDDDDDALTADDFEAPTNFKVTKIVVNTLRADGIVSHALNIARNRLEEIFLSSGLLLNGTKLTKKGEKMDEGDYVDVIVEKAEDELKVKRVKVLKVYPEKTGSDKFSLKVRIWKAPFGIPKPKHDQQNE